ncbi:MAG TPA: hypothetical protein VHO25_06200 [Polyangiaceae bacterium]|nr:hypothetical protein [Polyangiaceae bacterium]
MMQPKQLPLAITLTDGSLTILRYVVEGRFSPDVAVAMIARGEATGRVRADPDDTPEEPSVIVERLTTDEAISSEISRTPFASRVVSWRRLGPDELPTDYRYRDSWRDSGDSIGLDLTKARAERLNALRRERNAMLDQIDKDANKADDEGLAADARALRAKRPALRDMPARVSGALQAAQTADDLDAVTLPEV